VLCLDSRAAVRFELAGDGDLIDNLGTPSGSRRVQLANGRALIRVRLGRGPSAVAASSEGIETAVLTVSGRG
jgi:beta-galactosidase